MATKRQASKARATRKGARTVDAIVRVSRRNGREGNTFHSVEMQRQSIEAWCALNNVTIARWFDESESVSGGTTKRKGLQAAMTRACKGTTDGVIVSAVDRFARSLTEGVEEIKRLRDNGRTFIACEQGIDTANNTEGSIGSMLLGFMFLLAEWQRDTLTEKWNVVRERHIAQGKYTVEPFGYRKGDEGVLVPVALEAGIVAEVFERRAAGEGWGAIAKALNAAGCVTRAGKAWRPEGVQRMTRLRVYLGEISSGHDHVNANAHPAIITREVFDRVQARTNKAGTTRRPASDAFLLTGVLRCAGCGQTMVGATNNGGSAPRYRCRRNHAFGTCEAPANVNAADVDAYVTELLFTEARGVAVEGGTSTDAVDVARAHLDACEAALVAWSTDLANDVLRVSAPAAYAEGTNARIAARDAAQVTFNNAKAAAGAHGALPRNLVEVWNDPAMTNTERRGWLSSFFAVVAVRQPSRPKVQEHVSTRLAWWAIGDPAAPDGFAHMVGNRRAVARCPIMW